MTNQAIFDRIKACLDLEPDFLEVKLSQGGSSNYFCRLIDDGKHPPSRNYPHDEPPDIMLTKEAWYKRFLHNTTSICIWIDKEHAPSDVGSYSMDIPGCVYSQYGN